MNKLRLGVAAAAALALAACASAPAEPPLQGATMGGAFSLVDQNGRRTTDRDFAGKYRLVYFGFSFCPDVCPVDLAVIGQGVRALEKAEPELAAKLVPVFVTVDPARDTPAELKKFAAAFHPRLVALTGTEAEIAATARRYAVAYRREPGTTPGSYTMDHSRMAVLYGPDGAPIAIVPHDQGPGEVERTLKQWMT